MQLHQGETPPESRWEFVTHAYGPARPALADRLADCVRDWDQYVRHTGYPPMTVHPADTPDDELPAGDVLEKKTATRLVFQWPGRPAADQPEVLAAAGSARKSSREAGKARRARVPSSFTICQPPGHPLRRRSRDGQADPKQPHNPRTTAAQPGGVRPLPARSLVERSTLCTDELGGILLAKPTCRREWLPVQAHRLPSAHSAQHPCESHVCPLPVKWRSATTPVLAEEHAA